MADSSHGFQEGLSFWGAFGAAVMTACGAVVAYWREKLSIRIALNDVKNTADQAKKTSEENKEKIGAVQEQQIADSTKLDMILKQLGVEV